MKRKTLGHLMHISDFYRIEQIFWKLLWKKYLVGYCSSKNNFTLKNQIWIIFFWNYIRRSFEKKLIFCYFYSELVRITFSKKKLYLVSLWIIVTGSISSVRVFPLAQVKWTTPRWGTVTRVPDNKAKCEGGFGEILSSWETEQDLGSLHAP